MSKGKFWQESCWFIAKFQAYQLTEVQSPLCVICLLYQLYLCVSLCGYVCVSAAHLQTIPGLQLKTCQIHSFPVLLSTLRVFIRTRIVGILEYWNVYLNINATIQEHVPQ